MFNNCFPQHWAVTEAQFNKRLGERIRLLRMARDLSIRDLADRSDIDKATLMRIESGENAPRTSTLWKIARELNVPVRDLFSFESNP